MGTGTVLRRRRHLSLRRRRHPLRPVDGRTRPTSVTFNGNGSTAGATATETTNVPTPLTLNGFSRPGYVFSGWNTVAGGDRHRPTPTAPPIPSAPPSPSTPSGRPTRPTPSPSTATARPWGATATETTNVPTPLTLNGFSRTGFVFSGWNTLAGGTGTVLRRRRHLSLRRRRHPLRPVDGRTREWQHHVAANNHRHQPGSRFDRRWHEGEHYRDQLQRSDGGRYSERCAAIDVIVVNSTTITAASPAGSSGSCRCDGYDTGWHLVDQPCRHLHLRQRCPSSL